MTKSVKLSVAFVCAVFWAAPVTSDELTVDSDVVLDCFEETPVGAFYPDCLGQASGACQGIRSGTADGGTTLGITQCIQAETALWDEILNAQYKRVQAALAIEDDAGMRAGIDRTDALRNAQRAWIAFRDADCTARYAMWQDGSIRSIVGANCMMTMTARRALALRDMRGL